MATNQVTPVNVTVSTLTSGDIERDARKNEERAGKRAGVDVGGDTLSVKTSTTVGTASSGEAKPPVKGTAHQNLKTARSTLQNALKKTGIELKNDENLIVKSHEALDGLDEKIARYVEQGGKKDELAKWERQRDDILDALSAYETLQADAGEAPTVQSAATSEGAGGAQTESGAENLEPLWNTLGKDLKIIGLTVGKEETDIELVQNRVTAQFSKELAKYKEKEATLTAKKTELETQLKDAGNPADKKRIETELKAVKAELDTVLRDKKDLQISFLKVHETLMTYQAASDLGVAPKPKTETRTASVKSASAPSSPATTSKTASKTGPTVSTSSAGGSPAPAQSAQSFGQGGGVSLNTASAGGGQDDVSGAGLLNTESAGGVNVLSTSAMNDFTGTTLAIASTSNNLKSDTRKTEEAIKKLLRAAMSGNYEAIKTAMILLDKKASQTVIGMGTATIKAMQNYEKQMGELSKSMEKLSTKDPSYNAKLAKINSDMNMYSMNRQAISNFLRDTMSMREEIGNLTHGVLSKDGQIGSALSRWG